MDISKINLIATAAFGVESSLKREMQNLGLEITASADGRVEFLGDYSAIARANIWLRMADRILIKMGEFRATTFDELFDGIYALNWGDFVQQNGKIIVSAKSAKSTLFSTSDCQSIAKKAIIEKLKKKYNTEWFSEDGADYKIKVHIQKDIATITIDTTGQGLHKRGYRNIASSAPIKETLAAALLDISFWKRDRPLLDPMCGSGTIAIEAALIAKNIAPGHKRKFDAENWGIIPEKIWNNERTNAGRAIDREIIPKIYASDTSSKMIRQAKDNAIKAGVSDCIEFRICSISDIATMKFDDEFGSIITNPPYGERLGSLTELKNIYKSLSMIMERNKTWSSYIISADEEIEEYMGIKASKKRKLFNGGIKADYYQFYGAKPSK